MNSKLIKDLNVKLEIIKLLKKICSFILRHQSSQFFFFFFLVSLFRQGKLKKNKPIGLCQTTNLLNSEENYQQKENVTY